MGKAKPFDIPKREVWEAFKCVKANQGAAGVDRQSIADFEADLSNNLYKLWNRLERMPHSLTILVRGCVGLPMLVADRPGSSLRMALALPDLTEALNYEFQAACGHNAS